MFCTSICQRVEIRTLFVNVLHPKSTLPSLHQSMSRGVGVCAALGTLRFAQCQFFRLSQIQIYNIYIVMGEGIQILRRSVALLEV